MATVNIMKFLPNQYYLKCKYSGINPIKLQVYLQEISIEYRTQFRYRLISKKYGIEPVLH